MADEREAKPSDAADLARLGVAVSGAALVGVGGWLHYPPLGLVAAGAMIFAVAILGTLRAR